MIYRLAISIAAATITSIGSTAIIALVTAQEIERHSATSLGTVDFEANCQSSIDNNFNQAIALLHHMQYEQARKAFEQIVKSDPDCAMAHWGIAMTLFQPLWPSRPSVDDLKRGLDEIQTAQALGVNNERNADLVAATAAFYQDPETADWWSRIRRWHDKMETAYQAHPTDTETAVFYALSKLAIAPNQSDTLATNAEAAEILREIYERESTHPGAIHYTIHANDVDSRAGESLDIVRSYGEIAPDVPHALHMPTHIFVRLGYWPEVIEWNRKSAEAALNFPAADGLSHHYPHALDYLVYAYLQQGDDEGAQAVLNEVSEWNEPFQGTFISAFHLAAMPARYALERRAWEEAQAISPAEPNSIDWNKFHWAEAISWFAKGLGSVHMNDLNQAELAASRMARLRDLAKESGEEGFATYIEIDRLVLTSWMTYADGNPEKAIAQAREAIDLEATIQKHPVSPGSIYPAQESLGDLFLALERPKDALLAYEASLVTWPQRFNSMLGAFRAAEAAGLEKTATAHYNALQAIVVADRSNRPEIAEIFNGSEE